MKRETICVCTWVEIRYETEEGRKEAVHCALNDRGDVVGAKVGAGIYETERLKTFIKEKGEE